MSSLIDRAQKLDWEKRREARQEEIAEQDRAWKRHILREMLLAARSFRDLNTTDDAAIEQLAYALDIYIGRELHKVTI